ncbi:hypothetical protein BJX66DRAFT_60322 [Aspergillus keveii]|uniref:Uncharacterized protein n=1 Tax=Aspergillus keveii TaxID=714993 RepID=A0ABR4FQ62_9EURO
MGIELDIDGTAFGSGYDTLLVYVSLIYNLNLMSTPSYYSLFRVELSVCQLNYWYVSTCLRVSLDMDDGDPYRIQQQQHKTYHNPILLGSPNKLSKTRFAQTPSSWS